MWGQVPGGGLCLPEVLSKTFDSVSRPGTTMNVALTVTEDKGDLGGGGDTQWTSH